MSKKKILLIGIFVVILFLIIYISINIMNGKEMLIDTVIYNYMQNIRNEKLTNIVKFLTELGGAYVLISISLLSFVLIKNKKISILVASNLALISLISQGLKYLLQRARPLDMLVLETGYSFPSGHSMVSGAFYGFLIYLVFKKIKSKYLKWFLITILITIILIVGLSRIYLGVHYFTDVMGGILIAINYLIIYIIINKKRILKEKS